jgi:hypothetical protein
VNWDALVHDPAGAEALGAQVAAHAAGATAVVSWNSPDDAVLGHVVARALGVPRATVDLDLGRFTLEPGLPAGSRVLLVLTDPADYEPVASVATLLSGRAHELIAVARLVPELVVEKP